MGELFKQMSSYSIPLVNSNDFPVQLPKGTQKMIPIHSHPGKKKSVRTVSQLCMNTERPWRAIKHVHRFLHQRGKINGLPIRKIDHNKRESAFSFRLCHVSPQSTTLMDWW